MATVVFEVDTPSTANATSYVSGSFTPAVGDLLVVFVTASATISPQASLAYSSPSELTFSKISSATRNAGADTLYLFVSDGFVPTAASRSVTYDCIGDAATGTVITVYSISGMGRTGAAAVRQTAVQSNQASGTPAPVFASAALTANPVLGMVANGSNPAGMTPPTGSSPTWTEGSDSGYITPTTGQETIWAASGFTGTTVTWGNAPGTLFGSIIVELDASSQPFQDDTPPSLTQMPFDPQITVWQ